MKRAAAAAAFVVHLVCAAAAQGAQFSFGAFGDVPYTPDEEPQLVSLIAEMNHQPLAFALHVGDFKAAESECSDALFAQRLQTFGLSHHAFFYTPGDNEWVDCRRARWAPHDPVERLNRLRALFFARDSSLGQRPLRAATQRAAGYPENMRWMVQDMVFATVNIPGPNNHSGAAESGPRTRALLAWIRDAFALARSRRAPAIAIATQADLWIGGSAYADILETLAAEARTYDGEALVIHGDTHWFRFDKPLVDPQSGRRVENVTRLEVPGSPFVNWVYVTVTVENGRARFSAVPGSDIATKGR
jgi:hypothetical protein